MQSAEQIPPSSQDKQSLDEKLNVLICFSIYNSNRHLSCGSLQIKYNIKLSIKHIGRISSVKETLENRILFMP